MLIFLSSLAFGLAAGIRHGIDLDHIAAITDIISSQKKNSLAFFLASLYALGHGLVVICLGLTLFFIGQALPNSIDQIFGKVVGVTLILLGIYVLFSIIRDGKNFKLRSRWMLIFDAIRFGFHRLFHNFNLSHHHPKIKDEKYSSLTAFGIGMIHGIGAETPTQVSAFLVLLGVGGGVNAVLFLLVFVLGIFCSNLLVALFSIMGYKNARKNQKIYLVVGLLTGISSIILGILFLNGGKV